MLGCLTGVRSTLHTAILFFQDGRISQGTSRTVFTALQPCQYFVFSALKIFYHWVGMHSLSIVGFIYISLITKEFKYPFICYWPYIPYGPLYIKIKYTQNWSIVVENNNDLMMRRWVIVHHKKAFWDTIYFYSLIWVVLAIGILN